MQKIDDIAQLTISNEFFLVFQENIDRKRENLLNLLVSSHTHTHKVNFIFWTSKKHPINPNRAFDLHPKDLNFNLFISFISCYFNIFDILFQFNLNSKFILIDD